MPSIKIQIADLDRADVIELLSEHLEAANIQQASHAYSIDKLRVPDVFLFTARDQYHQLMGIAGLKMLSNSHGEIKSVRTHPNHLRKGVSTALMDHLTDFAKQKNVTRLSLETHPTAAYAAARALYERLGYVYCGPFADYTDVETSVFMTKAI